MGLALALRLGEGEGSHPRFFLDGDDLPHDTNDEGNDGHTAENEVSRNQTHLLRKRGQARFATERVADDDERSVGLVRVFVRSKVQYEGNDCHDNGNAVAEHREELFQLFQGPRRATQDDLRKHLLPNHNKQKTTTHSVHFAGRVRA